MRDHDQRHAARVEFLEQAHDFFAGGAIEVAGRFVGQDQRGLHDRRARNRDPLPLPARELVGPVLGAIGQTVVLQRLVDARRALGRRNACQHHRQRDVLGRRQPRHQMEALEHEADAPAA